MSISIRKLVVVVAIIWGGLWCLSRQGPPEEPVEAGAHSNARKEIRALLRESRRAGAKERVALQEEIRAIGPAGVPALVAALEDKNPRIRALAADVLKYSKDPSVAPHIEARLGDEHPMVRKAALLALGRLGAVGAAPAIISSLNDRDQSVRCHAALALGSLRDNRAVTPLIETLQSDTFSVARQTAANSLGEIGSMKAVRPLKAAMDDPDAKVRMAARSAIDRIKTGGPLGQDRDALGNWLDDKLRKLDSGIADKP